MSTDTERCRKASPFVYRYREMPKGLTICLQIQRDAERPHHLSTDTEMPKGLTICLQIQRDAERPHHCVYRYKEMPKGLIIVSTDTERCRKASPLSIDTEMSHHLSIDTERCRKASPLSVDTERCRKASTLSTDTEMPHY